ncbi:MAG: hypothetical protein WHS64_08810 [Fervidobacterium sp.]|uniref:Uncharacterized protein n=1 Tax=Fervidobacterium gondwanense DSM 13020 TaxID=1121883 RepID=A0A1M7TGG3_FERGO|nr:hypothetical protein [Fervidobacterium gondwanense]UXF00254.1 hypothetical protein IB67_01265 [Fervidobacterium riparium]SHN69834.1 hypothetical protein SAMN02745226_01976 [Fervidobacterium gondwanense DSM 13020]
MNSIIFRRSNFQYVEVTALWKPIGSVYVEWSFLTLNFYISSYLCPECGNHMVKTVFPNDLEIVTEEGSAKIPRIFACANCGTIHAPRPGYKLSSNNGFYARLDPESFENFIYHLDSKGSTTGRRGTLFNER